MLVVLVSSRNMSASPAIQFILTGCTNTSGIQEHAVVGNVRGVGYACRSHAGPFKGAHDAMPDGHALGGVSFTRPAEIRPANFLPYEG